MMTKKTAVLAALTLVTGAAQAALFDRGNGMIYDSTQNITWLADMNYAKTSGYDSDGKMRWSEALEWASALEYEGFKDWRLPTLKPRDESCSLAWGGGTGCTGGELSHLFAVDLGNKPNQSVLNQTGDTPEQVANLALFHNVQSYIYWSATQFGILDPLTMFYYSSSGVVSGGEGELFNFYAVAVRDGDVPSAVTAVPEPQSLALALLALGGTALARRRRS